MADDSAQPAVDDKNTEPSANPELLSDRYRIEETLGEGGMGKVYRAEHVLMKKQVAIKVLRRELSQDDEIVARFHREARAAAALDHPNVCQATDFGRNEEGAFFLVMEHLDGQTLQQLLEKRDRLPVKRVIHIARQIASALNVAHQRGIVHRDLKPENVMLVDRQGDPDMVKIMDFGIARLVATTGDDDSDGPTRLTRAGMVYGTPHYMSPEQVAGDDIDHRTDLYALGVVLFELLTGEPPYDGDNIARVMGQHITSPIPALSERCPEVAFPRGLEELLNSLLAKDREDRPSSASDVIRALDELDFSSPSSSQTDSPLRSATDRLQAITRSGVHIAGTVWQRMSTTERWIVGAVSAISIFFFVAVAATVAILVWGSGERQAEAVQESRQELLEDEQIASALDDAKEGDRTALNELLELHSDDAHLRFLALAADLEAGRDVDLIEEAEAILDIDSRYAHSPELVSRIVDRITSGSDGEAARELLARNMTSTVRSALAEKASIGNSRNRRDTAYELLSQENQLRRLDGWERAAVELRQASGCDEYEELIDKLVRIGDPAALPVLREFSDQPRRGCGRLGLSDCYRCVRGDVRDAIEALEEVEDKR